MRVTPIPTPKGTTEPADELSRLRQLATRLVEQDRLSHEIAQTYSQISARIYEFEREHARCRAHR